MGFSLLGNSGSRQSSSTTTTTDIVSDVTNVSQQVGAGRDANVFAGDGQTINMTPGAAFDVVERVATGALFGARESQRDFQSAASRALDVVAETATGGTVASAKNMQMIIGGGALLLLGILLFKGKA